MKAEELWQIKASIANPKFMEERVREVAEGHPLVKEIRVIKGQQLVEQGMNLFYNVGKGANCEPRCVIVHYVGDESRPDEVDVAFVGKGITFDTGGLNIKLHLIDEMHADKGGACSVTGALFSTLELKLKKNVVFSMAFAENAVGPDSYKPGDIITAMNGLTVEIDNTDAEGRLVMADTMTYVQRNFKPKTVFYVATLTGMVMGALGLELAGYFVPNEELAATFKRAAENANEGFWRLPILPSHREAMKGMCGGDLNNMGRD